MPGGQEAGVNGNTVARTNYRKGVKVHDLSQEGLQVMEGLRDQLDCVRAREKGGGRR
jgi:hypothetical protein